MVQRLREDPVVIVVGADRDHLAAERGIAAPEDRHHVARRILGRCVHEADRTRYRPTLGSGLHAGQRAAHQRLGEARGAVKEGGGFGSGVAAAAAAAGELRPRVLEIDPVRGTDPVERRHHDAGRGAEALGGLSPVDTPRGHAVLRGERHHHQLARRLLGGDERASPGPGVDRAGAVHRPRAGALVAGDHVGPRLERLSLDRERGGGIELAPEDRHRLEPAAVLARGLEADAPRFGRDPVGALHVARRAGAATLHGVVGEGVEAGAEVGRGDRGGGGGRRDGTLRGTRPATGAEEEQGDWREGGRAEGAVHEGLRFGSRGESMRRRTCGQAHGTAREHRTNAAPSLFCNGDPPDGHAPLRRQPGGALYDALRTCPSPLEIAPWPSWTA